MGLWDDLPAGDWPRAQRQAGACSARVLVAVTPSARDWDLVRQEGWYRIPLARAPQRIGAEYLAFYHPGCLGATRWSIPAYAPILGYRVATRGELLPEEADHPRAAELYYRIALGELFSLTPPIPSRRLRRVTFIRTTLDRLLAAREINDLWWKEAPGAARQRALRLGELPAAYAWALSTGYDRLIPPTLRGYR